MVANDGHRATRLPPWLGALTVKRRPIVAGKLVVGATVVGVDATWSGGWPDDADTVRIEACRTASAHNCRTIAWGGTTPAATLPTDLVGWDLRVASERFQADLSNPDVAYTPGAYPPLGHGRTVAGRPVTGPVRSS